MGDMICEAREAKCVLKSKTIPQTRNTYTLTDPGAEYQRTSGATTWKPAPPTRSHLAIS